MKKRNQRRAKTRFIFNKILDTMACQVCGESHNSVLDFHHIDPGTKDISVSDLKSKDYSPTKIISEISKCACVCSNCHRRLHADKEFLKSINLHQENIFRLTKTVSLAIKEWNRGL